MAINGPVKVELEDIKATLESIKGDLGSLTKMVSALVMCVEAIEAANKDGINPGTVDSDDLNSNDVNVRLFKENC